MFIEINRKQKNQNYKKIESSRLIELNGSNRNEPK